MMFALNWLYAPTGLIMLQVIACDAKFYQPNLELKRSACSWGNGGANRAIDAVILMWFIIGFPIMNWKLIQKVKPRPRQFNEQGLQIEYTDSEYKRDLDRNQSLFKSEFAPYEYRWAHYNSILLFLKFLVMFSTAVLTPTTQFGGRHDLSDPDFGVRTDYDIIKIQAFMTTAILGAHCLIAWSIRPFLDSKIDWVDSIGRFDCLLMAIFAIFSTTVPSAARSTSFVVLINLSHAIASLLMLAKTCYEFDSVRIRIKSMRRKLDFTLCESEKLPIVLSNSFNIAQERKARIWHGLWHKCMVDEKLRIPCDPDVAKDIEDEAKNGSTLLNCCGWTSLVEPAKYEPRRLAFYAGGGPAWLLNFAGSCEERLHELKEIVQFEGMSVLAKMEYSPEALALFATIESTLVGMDCFYDGPIEDKSIEQNGQMWRQTRAQPADSTNFGRLYVVPVPFTAIWLSDNGRDHAILSASASVNCIMRKQTLEELQQLVHRNKDPGVTHRRWVRQSLRCLHDGPVTFYHKVCAQLFVKNA